MSAKGLVTSTSTIRMAAHEERHPRIARRFQLRRSSWDLIAEKGQFQPSDALFKVSRKGHFDNETGLDGFLDDDSQIEVPLFSGQGQVPDIVALPCAAPTEYVIERMSVEDFGIDENAVFFGGTFYLNDEVRADADDGKGFCLSAGHHHVMSPICSDAPNEDWRLRGSAEEAADGVIECNC